MGTDLVGLEQLCRFSGACADALSRAALRVPSGVVDISAGSGGGTFFRLGYRYTFYIFRCVPTRHGRTS
jgi:hypothetical protein